MGVAVGDGVGIAVGRFVGAGDGARVGRGVGLWVGLLVGLDVGDAVGGVGLGVGAFEVFENALNFFSRNMCRSYLLMTVRGVGAGEGVDAVVATPAAPIANGFAAAALPLLGPLSASMRAR